MVLGATAAEMTAAEETVAAATEVVEMAEAETKSEWCPAKFAKGVTCRSYRLVKHTCGSSGI